jgi:hypothetical protein
VNWGIFLGILAILLMYPVGVLINLTTPLVRNWIATWSKTSLDKRIAKLESELSELEKNPPITEAEDHILWGLKANQMRTIAFGTVILGVLYFAVEVLADVNSAKYKLFRSFVVGVLVFGFLMQLQLRYEHDFRYLRSPRNREALRKSIAELKKIQENW